MPDTSNRSDPTGIRALFAAVRAWLTALDTTWLDYTLDAPTLEQELAQ